jgi:hypothetical protein
MWALGIRDDISFALEGLWLRLGELADAGSDRFEDLRDEVAVRYEELEPRTLLAVGAATVVVAAGLYFVQGSGEDPTATGVSEPVVVQPPAAPIEQEKVPAAPEPPASAAVIGEATLLERPGFSLALPNGWREIDPPEGASFAAASPDGLADATLWITEAPKLSFARFEEQSLERLAQLAPDARVISRSEGPTPETTVVELAAGSAGASADAPYRVTLRAGGPYRYYFATSLRQDAPADLVGDTELLRGTLRPDVAADEMKLP